MTFGGVMDLIKEATKDWHDVTCIVCGKAAKSMTKVEPWICSQECATADLRAQIADRDTEIERLTAIVEAAQAMIIVCGYPCTHNKCGNCNALHRALAMSPTKCDKDGAP